MQRNANILTRFMRAFTWPGLILTCEALLSAMVGIVLLDGQGSGGLMLGTLVAITLMIALACWLKDRYGPAQRR